MRHGRKSRGMGGIGAELGTAELGTGYLFRLVRRCPADGKNSGLITCVYDAAERLTSVTDAEGKQTTYAYDNANNLLRVTDANNRSTTYAYNAADRLTRIDYPDATYESFTYYATGALYTRRDGRGGALRQCSG